MQLVEIFRNDMEKIYPDIIDIIDKKKNDEYFLDVRNKNNKKKFQVCGRLSTGY